MSDDPPAHPGCARGSQKACASIRLGGHRQLSGRDNNSYARRRYSHSSVNSMEACKVHQTVDTKYLFRGRGGGSRDADQSASCSVAPCWVPLPPSSFVPLPSSRQRIHPSAPLQIPSPVPVLVSNDVHAHLHGWKPAKPESLRSMKVPLSPTLKPHSTVFIVPPGIVT